MIIVNLIGGLGNQMFQYAAGRALSLLRQQPLLLDISDYSGYKLHQGFELQRIFNCPAQVAAREDVQRILGWQALPYCRRVLARPGLRRFRRPELLVEPCFQYWPGLSAAPQDCYLMGYWQSEKYFGDVAQVIRSDFAFKQPLSADNAALAERFELATSISLHVRRGDYVGNPKAAATHGVCSLDYYESAVRYIVERVENPCFYIFSDDPDWVRKNLKIDFPCCYVDRNKGEESYNDMRLMSMCRHHIIANSSFSWWGAWLNPDPSKLVIAPQHWFANDNDIGDLFPEGWVAL